MGPTQSLSLGVKRPSHEADHSPPSVAEVTNAWNYTSTLHTSSWRGAWLSTRYVFMAWYLVKTRDITFTLQISSAINCIVIDIFT
jgi:hypothetical protein